MAGAGIEDQGLACPAAPRARARAAAEPGGNPDWSAPMTIPFRIRRFAIATAAAICSAAAAHAATPDATIRYSGGSVAFIGGVNWGSGTLTYKGKEIPVEISGLTAGSIGASKIDASGEVYNLKQASDIEGTYAAVSAGATVGGGGGVLDMKNSAGVEIKARATTAGLKLTLGASGMTVKLKK
jgi:hypothetical protein